MLLTLLPRSCLGISQHVRWGYGEHQPVQKKERAENSGSSVATAGKCDNLHQRHATVLRCLRGTESSARPSDFRAGFHVCRRQFGALSVHASTGVTDLTLQPCCPYDTLRTAFASWSVKEPLLPPSFANHSRLPVCGVIGKCERSLANVFRNTAVDLPVPRSLRTSRYSTLATSSPGVSA